MKSLADACQPLQAAFHEGRMTADAAIEAAFHEGRGSDADAAPEAAPEVVAAPEEIAPPAPAKGKRGKKSSGSDEETE